MSVTPRATPVVQPPTQTTTIRETEIPKQLKAPIVVVAAGAEWEHECGELIIGRDIEATVVLEDPLVSRFHARLNVGTDGRVTLEDLHSANGVFVNGSKLSRPSMVLGEGDRLLIGTTEVSVFSLRASAQVRLGRQIAKIQPVAVVAIDATEPPSRTMPSAGNSMKAPAKRTFAATGRSDAMNLVGQFAEQLMDSGNPLEATRVLSEHLQNLMKGASVGLSVPSRILESATGYALRLHRWTKRDTWLEFVLELHLAALQVPSNASLSELESRLGTTFKLDPALVRYFITTIETRGAALTADERSRLQRIERFGK